MSDVRTTPHAEISGAVAHLYKSRTGRGPTTITTLLTSGLVVCVIEDSTTPFEGTLMQLGAAEVVNEARRTFQRAVGPQLVEEVERILGRTVRGHVPTYDAAVDAGTDLFLLEAVPA
ncbi:Na-translocating system protein MpsC family protein [Patulibacter sp. NPDC049589]|uniref:Na-translocating system protein MpsC family protein n=1 Tax=Patulibacter sp. NPDC049589 TaxID=3154731 RepID=UPI00342E797F